MGHVYILANHEVGFYKIGCTSGSVVWRVQQFAPKLPFEVEIVMAFRCVLGQERAAEHLLHRRFADKRANGEWFRLDEEDFYWLLLNDPLPLPIFLTHDWLGYSQEDLREQNDANLELFAMPLGLS
jgi:hypothetical protein